MPLKWHYPLGLLYDLYSGAEPFYSEGPKEDDATVKDDEAEEKRLPWKLTVHFSDYPVEQLVKLDADGKVLHDLFINNVKEADFLRNGTGKTIMSMTKDDSTQLWRGVQDHSFNAYSPINQKLLNPIGTNLRHIPIKLYLPHAASEVPEEKETATGSLRVLQGLVTTNVSSRTPQTIGTALNQMVPSLFPSRRIAMMAQPVLHGAVLPLGAGAEDVLRTGAYLDGWLHIAVVMMG